MKALFTSKITPVACALLLVSALNSRAQEKVSLQKAVDLALERNLTIKQSRFNEALDDANLSQSKYNQLPSVTSSPQASYNFGRSLDPTTYQYTANQTTFLVNGSVNAQVTLFQGGQLRNQIIQNRLIVDADKSSTAKVKNDLVLNVIVGFLQILTNQDLVTAATQQLDIAKQTLSRSDINFKVGNQTLADLSQAKAGVSTAELNLTTAQNQLDLSVLVLKQYMEMDPSTKIDVERPDISKITDVQTLFVPGDILSTALNVNPDVKLAEAQEAVSKQGIKVAQGSYFPSLALFSQIGSNYSDASRKFLANGQTAYYPFGQQLSDHFYQGVGVSLQIPIFNKFNAHTNVKKAKISYENSQVSTQLAKNNLAKTIYQAVLDARAAGNQFQSAQQTYLANKDAFNVIQQRYNVGLVNSLDYNTSLTNLNKSQNDMIQARYQMIFRSKVIDYYLGKPITL